MEKKILQWHSGFRAILQLELSWDNEDLKFHREFNLNQKSLRIDSLIIRPHKECGNEKALDDIFKIQRD